MSKREDALRWAEGVGSPPTSMLAESREPFAYLRHLLSRAAPGPWEVVESEPDGCGITEYGVFAGGEPVSVGSYHQDASLIAAALNALPELLKIVESLQPVGRAAARYAETFGGCSNPDVELTCRLESLATLCPWCTLEVEMEQAGLIESASEKTR